MSKLNKKDQEILYNQLVEITDLLDVALYELEYYAGEDKNDVANLMAKVITQMDASINDVTEHYLDWIESGQKYDKSLVNKIELAIRKVFTVSTTFLDEIKKFDCHTESNDTAMPNEILLNLDKIVKKIKSKKGILPKIGNNPGELIHGPVGNGFFDAADKQPLYARIILGVKNAMDHFFRITYCFFRLENGLVSDPNKVIWGRRMPDIKAKQIMDKANIVMGKVTSNFRA